MLALGMNEKQWLNIHTSDGLVRVAWVQRDGGRLRFAIDAPKSVLILRDKVVDTGAKGVSDGAREADMR